VEIGECFDECLLGQLRAAEVCDTEKFKSLDGEAESWPGGRGWDDALAYKGCAYIFVGRCNAKDGSMRSCRIQVSM